MSIFIESESYRPFIYPWAIEAAKKQVIDMYWDVHQIELQDDLMQYNSKEGLKTLNCSHEFNKNTLDLLLPLFTQLDKTVADGYVRLLPFTKNNEIKTLFIAHAQKESVHQRGYALAAEAFGTPDSEWLVFNTYKAMREKLEVITGGDYDLSKPLDYAKFLTNILLGEGIGLFAAFVILLNYKRSGLLMGFNDVNSWSLSDETAHVENNIKVIDYILTELTYTEKLELQRYTKETIKQFIKVEHNFIDLIYEAGEQESLTILDLKSYIEYLGELRQFQLGYLTFKEVRVNQLEWMEWMLSGVKHDNFFEKRVTSYSHKKLEGEIDCTKYLPLLKDNTRFTKY